MSCHIPVGKRLDQFVKFSHPEMDGYSGLQHQKVISAWAARERDDARGLEFVSRHR
jgi:hypothetical protein